MLTYPDRQRFEQIRARWETAQPSEEGEAEMVGRKDKSTPQQPTSAEAHDNGARKFRRKLSHGLSLFSNPLSQWKITPGHTQLEAPPLAVTEPSTTDVTTAAFALDVPVFPMHSSTSLINLVDTARGVAEQTYTNTPSNDADANITIKPLPRSRTLSFIPLSVQTEPNIFATDIDEASNLDLVTRMSQLEFESVPTKIPTPSPPLYDNRCSSPRRYLHHHVPYYESQQSKRLEAALASVGTNKEYLAKRPQTLWSRTASNISKEPNVPHAVGFMAPRKPGPRGPIVSQGLEKPILQENIPIDKRITNRQLQIQERVLKRESLAVAGTLYDKKSFGASTPVMQGRKTSFATPPTASKRMSSHNTPVTVKRIQRDNQVNSQPSNCLTMKPGLGSRPPIADTLRAPTVHEAERSKQSLICSYTQAGFSRKTPNTPNCLGGVWRPNRVFGVSNHEVSKSPRSQTFHNFGTWPEDAPPVPPLPAEYRQSSLSDLARQLRMSQEFSTKPRHGRMVSDVALWRSIVEESSEEIGKRDYTTLPVKADGAPSTPPTLISSTVSSTVFPLRPNTPCHLTARAASTASETIQSCQGPSRESSRDAQEEVTLDDTDPVVFQVEDYMPPLYWAGRFQSRYDQWRTDVMNAELNLHSDRQVSSPLSEPRLDQESLAACHIFVQLRELCASDRAADSLWEFESKYRKDHKLPGNPPDLLPRSLPKKEYKPTAAEAETGALGRAIRKLTPRKNSFVNLMKGKGWNKSDEAKQNDELEDNKKTFSENSQVFL